MPGGWGKRAVGRADRKLEDDELFKEIGGQLEDANFDYSQWQRTKGKRQSQAAVGILKKESGLAERYERPATVHTGFTVSSGARTTSPKLHRATSTDPYACKHKHGRPAEPAPAMTRKERALKEAEVKRKSEQVKILQLRIQARHHTIREYRRRKGELLLDNMAQREGIDGEEAEAHVEVKKLLRKYEQFRGGISTLNDRFLTDLDEAKRDLDQVRLRVEVDIAGLQREVDAADAKLKDKQGELHILMNYKDKEYPVKSLRISELQKEIENLKITHTDDETELQHIVETEIDKFRSEQARVKKDITETVTEKALSVMHTSLKDMALQNVVMAKEKEFHEREVEELTEQNAALEAEVHGLLRDPKTSIRQQMFPEFYPTREKCTPDMDVILDIPTQEWLPI